MGLHLPARPCFKQQGPQQPMLPPAIKYFQRVWTEGISEKILMSNSHNLASEITLSCLERNIQSFKKWLGYQGSLLNSKQLNSLKSERASFSEGLTPSHKEELKERSWKSFLIRESA